MPSPSRTSLQKPFSACNRHRKSVVKRRYPLGLASACSSSACGHPISTPQWPLRKRVIRGDVLAEQRGRGQHLPTRSETLSTRGRWNRHPPKDNRREGLPVSGIGTAGPAPDPDGSRRRGYALAGRMCLRRDGASEPVTDRIGAVPRLSRGATLSAPGRIYGHRRGIAMTSVCGGALAGQASCRPRMNQCNV